MKYDEFRVRLQDLKEQFRLSEGREPLTLAEFEAFLDRRKAGKTRPRTLRSLKGLDL